MRNEIRNDSHFRRDFILKKKKKNASTYTNADLTLLTLLYAIALRINRLYILSLTFSTIVTYDIMVTNIDISYRQACCDSK